MWQKYRPAPSYIPRPKFDEDEPNAIHQADLLFSPHDIVPTGRNKQRTYKYALTVVEPLTDKTATQVMDSCSQIYKHGLRWPDLLHVDPGKEFMGGVTQLMKQKGVKIRRGEAGNYRAQGIVERMKRTLAERSFPHQYAQEMVLGQRERGARSTEWVRQLRPVLDSMKNSETRRLGKKPADAIKLRRVSQKPSTYFASRRCGKAPF